MCGIAGIVNYERRYSKEQLQALTLAMRDSMTHRGPDDAGLWISDDGLVCFAHRRLSIIDLRPEGRQPMLNEDGSVAITFNGEIYNYRELTADLNARGHRFATRTDTETLCHLFEDNPVQAVSHLQGMYAFAAWNRHNRELVLARDPFGKKPLYYAMAGGVLAFASELRALECVPGICSDIDPVAVQEYLLLQYVHAPRTIYHRVRKLEPGTLLRLRFANESEPVSTCHRHFVFKTSEPSSKWSKKRADESTALNDLRRLVIDAVRDRLVADVPLGAFLSGGIDSSLVVGIMAKELGVRAKTFSIGFKDSPDSEHHAARLIAESLGTDHNELIVDPSAVDLLPTIAAALDEPNGDSSCLPVYLLSEFTRKHVTVALSGDGGDELFGGYRRYTDTLAEARDPWRHIRSFRRFRRPWRAGTAYLSARWLQMPEETLVPMLGPLHPEAAGLIAGWRRHMNDRSRPLIHRMRMLDVESYLPGAVLAKVDRMSMQFALEVRCPLLDVRLGRWAARLPAEWCHDRFQSKRLLKRLAAKYLPREIIERPKMGFGLPERAWSKERLLNLTSDLLLGSGSQLPGYLDRGSVRRYLQIQRLPNCFSVYQIWGLLVLEQWLRRA
ncbi:MAG TPA: asparagine synthase (glutamine-hydrolyzing), partial [Gemmataceae bacterium]|nr:asparagine synthase (glutamine-hydrolyzing) [Gemmataceae bacterium]